jgi:hypothetical protein
MKQKKLIFVLIGIVIGGICFAIGWWIKDVQCEDTILYDYAVKIDSLKGAETLRQDEQLPYYGMEKEKVLSLLPSPKDSGIGMLFDEENLPQWHWLYNPYKEKLKGTQDTIIVDTYYWEIPYHDRPNLYIVFEKRGEQWIVSTCVQWDSERVFID